MIALRLAAVVAALVTIILNAHHGFKSSVIVEYAVLFATLNASFDLAKCSCLVGMGRAWQQGHRLTALLLLALFVPLFANSLWCGVSEVVTSRAADTGKTTVANEARARAEADHPRLTAELATMQASPTFAASAGCALPKSQTARDYCAKVEATKTALAIADQQLTAITPTDPEPQFTLAASLTGWSLPSLKLTQALSLVVLAELVGSVGFYLSSQINSKASGKAAGRRWFAQHAKPAKNLEIHSAAAPEALATMPNEVAPTTKNKPPAPSLTWAIPKPP